MINIGEWVINKIPTLRNKALDQSLADELHLKYNLLIWRAKNLFVFISCMCTSLNVDMCTMGIQCPQRLKDGIRSPGAKGTGYCEPPFGCCDINQTHALMNISGKIYFSHLDNIHFLIILSDTILPLLLFYFFHSKHKPSCVCFLHF